ncbi:hypothetical protein QYF61_007699 [Mycteria americana]|uniref:Uncharacterized protein n=1 Tax=Mycteria americana TaxID=33587 RepID=A0AAN7RPF1_MYCAM|nr:hypothetical protein QYF61_007699 [Mycteria americana]
MEKATLEQVHLKATVAVDKSMPQQGQDSPHTLPLLQHGVPPTGDSPPRTSPMWVLPTGCSSSQTAPAWVPSMGCSPSGTDCSSVGPPQGHRSCQQTCSSVGSSLHGVTGPASKPAPEWAPLSTGSQVLPGACSSMRSPWGHSLLQVYPPAWSWGPPQAAGCSPSGTDCSSVGHPQGHRSCQQTCSSVGSSPWGHRSCQEPAPACTLHGVTTSFRCIHLLGHEVLHGLQVDICSTVDFHGLQGDNLHHHGLHHWLCPTWGQLLISSYRSHPYRPPATKTLPHKPNTPDKPNKSQRSHCSTTRIVANYKQNIKKIIIPIYSMLMRPHLKYCAQFWDPHFERYVEKLVRVQERATKIVRGLKHMFCEEWLRGLGLFSLVKRTLMENVIAACKYLKVPGDITRGNGHKLWLGRFRLDIRKNNSLGGSAELEHVAQRGFVSPFSQGAAGVASVRRHQKLPPCQTEPVPAGSKTDPLLAKAEPINQ